jgi:hypothetical protein
MAAPRVYRGRLTVDGQFWGLSSRASAGLLITPFAGALLVGLAAFRSGLYSGLVREDRLLEWLQFGSYAAATGLAVAAGVRLERRGRRLSVLALCALASAGEEISWGQRLFGFDPPDALEELNSQEELNVHDVVEVQGKVNLALALASLYGLAAPWLSRRRSLVVPPAALGSAFFVMLAYTAARAAFFPHPGHALAKYSEWPEACFAAAIAVYSLLAWRKADLAK